MKKIAAIGAFIAFGAFMPTAASAASNIDSCVAALQFDTVTFNQNVMAQLSILSMVNESNYEQAKQNMGASVPGYFSGTFNDFKQKRQELSRSLSVNQSLSVDSNYYQRVLSPAGAQAYSKCVSDVIKQPLSAYISSGQRSRFVAVTIASNVAGNSKMALTIITPDYIKRMNEPKELAPGSQQTILFESPLDKPFVVVINGDDKISGASYAPASLEMPPYVEYRKVSTYKEYLASGRCGAGGNGSTTGSPLRESVYFAADAGYSLMPETVSLVAKTLQGGPGLVRDPNWQWKSSPADTSRPVAMQSDPDSCEGASPHTQSIVSYQFRVRAVSESIVKVGP